MKTLENISRRRTNFLNYAGIAGASAALLFTANYLIVKSKKESRTSNNSDIDEFLHGDGIIDWVPPTLMALMLVAVAVSVGLVNRARHATTTA